MVDLDIEKGVKFAKNLLDWNRKKNKRAMPWKGERDAYKVWLSEIILQQTRVEQGLKYYQNFINNFPTIQDLAAAQETKVYKLWEGLGYYSRCKNLIITARYIANDLEGKFPDDYQSILSLKGVGPYTAAAIASFAYNLPYAVLDGNVFRVLARIFDIEIPIDSTEGKKLFSNCAQEILPKQNAGEYNQAIMDFGATICKPVPECAVCFFKDGCKAFQLGNQQLLPVKEKKVAVKERWFNYLILNYKNKIAIKQRGDRDIWNSLFEFLLIESDRSLPYKQLLLQLEKGYIKQKGFKISNKPQFELIQKLTHQLIHFKFLEIELENSVDLENFIWISKKELQDYPFPKTLQTYISTHL